MNKTLSPLEREAIMLTLRQQFIQEELTQGELPKLLRKKVLGFSQQRNALLAGISLRTLSDIEQDKGNTTLTTLNRAFKPFGLRTGLLPHRPAASAANPDPATHCARRAP